MLTHVSLAFYLGYFYQLYYFKVIQELPFLTDITETNTDAC